MHTYGRYVVGEFNLNGFYSVTNPLNNEFKMLLINNLYFDFVILPETHCLPDEILEIKDYKVYQYNRPNQGNARRGSGGIAIAIHLSMFYSHTVESVEYGEDGQLSIILRNTLNDFLIGILALYLPPDSYIYGRDPEQFFNNAAVLWENLSDCDLVVGGGDVNSRTKDLVDFIADIDGSLIPSRSNPDRTKNRHADSFINFLKRSLIAPFLSVPVRY